jgi:hypothetical protein
MHYKTKSALTIGTLVAIMIVIGVFINQMDLNITGAIVAPVCNCDEDADCDDGNPETEDICLYPESCKASTCVNKEK